jgi:ABC-type branched-subunit amino acid transport system substrate-binding protein
VEIPPNPYVFHLMPGVADQVRVLVRRALQESIPSVALAATEEEIGTEGRRAFENEMSLHGAAPATVVPIPSLGGAKYQVVEALAPFRPTSVIVIGSPHDVAAAASVLRAAPWRPQVMSLAALYGKEVFELPPSAAEGMLLAYPGPLPGDGERQLRIFSGFLEEAGVRPRFVAFQLVALAAAQVLVEGLKKAGRDLTRDGLVAALETLRDYPTALAAPVTFGPNMRTGVRAARLVRPDPEGHRFVLVEPPSAPRSR